MHQQSMRLHRRDFLKASTAASTATAFQAFAWPGTGPPYVATQATDKSGINDGCTGVDDRRGHRLFRASSCVAPDHEAFQNTIRSHPAGRRWSEVTMTAGEMRWTVDDGGAEIWASTFERFDSRSADRCHQDDELTASPAENLMEHHIDFHASTGALGGGELDAHRVPVRRQCCARSKPRSRASSSIDCAPGGTARFSITSCMG